jgi:hypothetical protein
MSWERVREIYEKTSTGSGARKEGIGGGGKKGGEVALGTEVVVDEKDVNNGVVKGKGRGSVICGRCVAMG